MLDCRRRNSLATRCAPRFVTEAKNAGSGNPGAHGPDTPACACFQRPQIYANVRDLLDVSNRAGRAGGAHQNAPRWVQVGIKDTLQ
jgi:hypothetical protein